MKSYLLDTHTLLWYFGGNNDLSAVAKQLMADPDNRIIVSLISIWEIAIKVSLGKLNLPKSLPDLERSIREEGFELLSLNLEEINIVATLEWHHRDPFDRLLIAQAVSLKIPIIGKDEVFDRYGMERLW